MGKFKGERGGGFGGKKRFDGDRGRRDDRSGRPGMHRATCADCGKKCEVPFKPTGDKPVYCSDCFSMRSESDNRFDRRDSDRRDFGRRESRSSFGEKQMFAAVCDECGAKCEVPFKPSSDKPIFCNDCFGNTERGNRSERREKGGDSDQYKKQFEILNNKLDSILKMLSESAPAKKVIEEQKEEKPAVKETKKSVKEEKVKKVVAKKKEAAAPKKTVKKAVVKKKK